MVKRENKKNKVERKKIQEKKKKKKKNNEKKYQQKKEYILIKIPLNFYNIKNNGNIKLFEKVLNFQISQKRKWKSALFTINQSKCSYNLENRWAILLGNNMTRIASKENFLQILKERNDYSVKLYGIPKQASTVIL